MERPRLKNYFLPTPKNMRKLGDALLGVSTMLTGFGILANLQWLAIIFLLIGVVGKFLTNFFKEEV